VIVFHLILSYLSGLMVIFNMNFILINCLSTVNDLVVRSVVQSPIFLHPFSKYKQEVTWKK